MVSIILLLLLYVVFLHAMPVRYIYYMPVLPIYPDNVSESRLVYDLTLQRTQRDLDFFEKTDYSIVYAFNEIVDIPVQSLFDIISKTPVMMIMLSTKYSINRARPWQIDRRIQKRPSITDKTPSYPAGHALQAYYLSYVLGNIYPERRDVFEKIAYECDRTRVYAGLHYPSDGVFSKKLVRFFTNIGVI